MTKAIHFLLILFTFTLPFNKFTLNAIPIIVFILWLAEGDMAHKWQTLRRCKIFWIFAGLSVLYLLSFLWSGTTAHGYFGKAANHAGLAFWVEKYLYPLILLPVIVTKMDKKLFQSAVSAFLAGMFLSEVLSYGIFFRLWEFGRGIPEDPTPFLHRTAYSTFLVLTIFILLYRVMHTERKGWKIFYLIFAFSATGNLFLNGGRTGQVAFILSALYFTLHYFHYSLKALLGTAVAITLVVTIAWQSSPVFQKRMHETGEALQKMRHHEYRTSFGQRVAIWMTVIEVVKEHPILGAGLGNARAAVQRVQRERYPERTYVTAMPHVHNQFLQSYLEGGIFAVVLWLWLFYLLLRENFYEYTLYARVFAISLLIFFLVDTPFLFRIGASYLLFFTALLFGYRIWRREKADA
jgi:O-antigen ligase